MTARRASLRLAAAAAALAVGLALIFGVVHLGSLFDEGKTSIESSVFGTGKANYEVDAIFDTGRGILPGQLVKIAGARAGVIDDVTLTPDYKARVKMRVEGRFAPFRADARCAIRPEGLIGEHFVQCDPGTPDARPLTGKRGNSPTVPVKQTTLPVDINDLFQILDAPSRDRLAVIVATLGLGVAGRGDDLNGVIRRSNPTLASARRVLDVLAGQRRELATTITSTDRVLAELARRRGRVRDFIDQAARVTRRTADHRTALAEAVRRLPPMLDRAQPALERLDRLADDATPLLLGLRRSAPGLDHLLAKARPFGEAATPVVRGLRRVAPQARRAIRAAGPTVKRLRHFARVALPVGRSLNRTVESLRDRGFVESLLTGVYRLSATVGRFDGASHLFPIVLFLEAGNGCLLLASKPNPNCDARYGHGLAPASKRARRRKPGHHSRRHSLPRQAPSPALPAPQARKPTAPAPPPKPLRRLLDGLLGNPPPSGGESPAPADPLGGLLDYLLR